MLYPQKINAKNMDLIIKISIIISVFLGIFLVFLNRMTTPNIHWAGLCNAGIIYIWVTVLYSINKNINIAGHVLIQTIAISLLTVYIDYKTGFKAWSVNLSIPIIIIIANISLRLPLLTRPINAAIISNIPVCSSPPTTINSPKKNKSVL